MISIIGNGSGSIETSGLDLLGSFNANISSINCGASNATAEFKLVKKASVLTLNTCPSWGGECLNLTREAELGDKSKPTISFQSFDVITRQNQLIQTSFYIKDDSGKASYQTNIYSDGKKLSKETSYWSTTSGDPILSTFQPTVISGENGPFYVCVVAGDASGNWTGEFDNCQWRSIEVPIAPMTNGCGSQDMGFVIGSAQNFLLNKLSISLSLQDATKYNKGKLVWNVDVTAACDNHDAGYYGATFKDAVLGKLIDSRLNSRSYVDEKFRQDIMLLCKRSKGIPKAALKTCLEGEKYSGSKVLKLLTRILPTGATTYWSAVRAKAKEGYDADSTKVGIQKTTPKSTKPVGGQRNNT
jgi:hypothetical protein